MARYITAQEKRGAIRVALVTWPPGLGRIVAEYAISAGELIDEYAKTLPTYDYMQTSIWDHSDYRINIVWLNTYKSHSLHILVYPYYTDWIDDILENNDLIGTVGDHFQWTQYRESILEAVRQMVESTMKANIATSTMSRSGASPIA